MISLHGKLALITGGSRGIGLAIAQNFARQGASTILVARNAERLRAAVASVQAQCTTPPSPDTPTTHDDDDDDDVMLPFHTGFTGDVSSPEMWQSLSTKLDRGHFGRREKSPSSNKPKHPDDGEQQQLLLPDRVDVLVNCAGITQESLLWRTDPEKVAAILDTNLRGAVLGCKYISKLMAKKHDGMQDIGKGEASIINVSSVMATMGGSGASVYAASKAGLLGLTSALALEMRTRMIRVNALVPGYIETDMTESDFRFLDAPTERSGHDVDLLVIGLSPKQLSSRIPMGRLGKVEEVADAAAFLAQNSYANNCVLTIDGGLSAGFFAS